MVIMCPKTQSHKSPTIYAGKRDEESEEWQDEITAKRQMHRDGKGWSI